MNIAQQSVINHSTSLWKHWTGGSFSRKNARQPAPMLPLVINYRFFFALTFLKLWDRSNSDSLILHFSFQNNLMQKCEMKSPLLSLLHYPLFFCLALNSGNCKDARIKNFCMRITARPSALSFFLLPEAEIQLPIYWCHEALQWVKMKEKVLLKVS